MGKSNGDRRIFNLSPLIRITLLGLYAALLLPLPILAQATAAPLSPALLTLGVLAGAVLLYAALSERVLVDEAGIQVVYAAWVPSLWRSGWSLRWQDIKALKPRSTGQGGIVYYFVAQPDAGNSNSTTEPVSEQRAYLLPMRVAGFAELVRYVQAQTDIDMTDVRPLAQPWMYLILLSFTLVLMLIDGWVVWMALSHQLPMPL